MPQWLIWNLPSFPEICFLASFLPFTSPAHCRDSPVVCVSPWQPQESALFFLEQRVPIPFVGLILPLRYSYSPSVCLTVWSPVLLAQMWVLNRFSQISFFSRSWNLWLDRGRGLLWVHIINRKRNGRKKEKERLGVEDRDLHLSQGPTISSL